MKTMEPFYLCLHFIAFDIWFLPISWMTLKRPNEPYFRTGEVHDRYVYMQQNESIAHCLSSQEVKSLTQKKKLQQPKQMKTLSSTEQ